MIHRKSNNVKCALCDQFKPLVKSHILSSFLYKEIGGDEGKRKRYKVIHADPNRGDYKGQGGIKEPLLCSDCEQKLGLYESYSSQVLYGGTVEIEIERLNRNKLIEVRDIDYHKFKIFLMSNLWRASISRNEFFENVDLGSKHNNILKEILFHEKSGSFDEYGCLLTLNLYKGIPFSGVIRSLGRNRFQGHNIQGFNIGALGLTFFISNHNIPSNLSDNFLNENGTLKLIGIGIEQQETFQHLAAVIAKKKSIS